MEKKISSERMSEEQGENTFNFAVWAHNGEYK